MRVLAFIRFLMAYYVAIYWRNVLLGVPRSTIQT